MTIPASVESRFEILGEFASAKILRCFRVKDRKVNGQEQVLRLLPEKYSHDASIVREFHKLFSRLSNIPNRTHIPSVYQVSGDVAGTVYVLEELVSGLTLPDFIKKNRQASGFFQNLIQILTQTCEALHHAHQKDIFHLCLLPEDILVDESTRKVKLVGFGAQIFCAGGHLNSLSEKVKRFIAPEVLREGKIQPSADVYSFASVIAELIPEIKDCGDMLGKALSSNPETRYSKVREFEEALEGIPKDQLLRSATAIPTSSEAKGGIKPVPSIRLVTDPP